MVEACERRILEFPLDMERPGGRQGAKARGLVCLGVKLSRYCLPDQARAGKREDLRNFIGI